MPSNTTSHRFFYIYILESLLDHEHYTGYTKNLKRSLSEHYLGKSFATKFRLPFRLIYFEGCLSEEDARRRENYLKTHQGRKFLGLRLIHYTQNKAAFGMRG